MNIFCQVSVGLLINGFCSIEVSPIFGFHDEGTLPRAFSNDQAWASE